MSRETNKRNQPNERQHIVTINDVADYAGVSKSTVSKVLNGWTTISASTCDRVHEAMRILGYIPNQRAVNFARQVTKNIVYLTDLGKDTAYRNPHMFDIMCGVHKEISDSGYTLELIDTSSEEYPGQQAIREINRRSADGLIIHGSAVNKELAVRLSGENIPHIIIGKPMSASNLCWIDTDHTMAGEMAANHLCDYGYNDILFIGGRKNDTISNERKRGLQRGLISHSRRLTGDRILYTDATKQAAADVLISELNDPLKVRPDAIVCENSLLALGAMQALNGLSLSLPEDIGLITFDKYPFSTIIDPTPTIVDIDMYDMGIQAGRMMLRKLDNPNLSIQSYTTLPMIIRGVTTRPQ